MIPRFKPWLGWAEFFALFKPNRGAVERFWFKEHYRVLVPDAGEKQALGRARAAGNNDLQAGRVRVIRLGALAVIVSPVADGSVRRPECQAANVEHVAASISVLGRFVRNLVECRKRVVGKLKFGNSGGSLSCHADGKTRNTLLCERRIEHSVLAKLFLKLAGASEDASKSDILAKNYGLIVSFQRDAQRIINGADEIHFLGASGFGRLKIYS